MTMHGTPINTGLREADCHSESAQQEDAELSEGDSNLDFCLAR